MMESQRTTGDLYQLDCPCCGYTNTDLWDVEPETDDTIECQGCGQVLLLTVKVIVHAEPATKDNDQP